VIPLTRPDGSTLLVNPDRIETVEETPDTVVTLAEGKKLLVRESAAVVADRFHAYKRALHSDTRFGGRRRSDPPADADPAVYGNPNRATMRRRHSDSDAGPGGASR
jgi:flagellar protein FlbD